METPVELRYAGVVVAKATEVRKMTVGGVDLFLAIPEPLPAGTVVALGNEGYARIEKVIESPDHSTAGVYVTLLSEADLTLPWVPSFREAEVPAPRPPAVVVSPVIVRPVHRISDAPRPEPAPPPARAEVAPPLPPVRDRAAETPLPEVVAVLAEPEPVPQVERLAPPPAPFVTSMPQPGEKVAHFEEPPPAVVERAVKRERTKRSTLVMSVPPPAADPVVDDARPSASVKAVGEIDTGSRRVQPHQPHGGGASIVVEEEPHEAETAAAADGGSDEASRQTELRIEDLSTARPLPSARGRATKRRRTQR
jgi:hypothetical protein